MEYEGKVYFNKEQIKLNKGVDTFQKGYKINPAIKNPDIFDIPEKVINTNINKNMSIYEKIKSGISSLPNLKIDKQIYERFQKIYYNYPISIDTPFIRDYLINGFIIIIAGTMAISGISLGSKILFFPTKKDDENRGKIYYYTEK
jgi:hypothetical protein